MVLTAGTRSSSGSTCESARARNNHALSTPKCAWRVPQQIAHWARIGRELEMSPQVNHRAITQVLAGADFYDSLDEHEQAIVREEWVRRATALPGALNYATEIAAAGESYSEADQNVDQVVYPARS